MEIKLEELEYQQTAIKSIVSVFDGNDKNTFEIGRASCRERV